MADTIDSSSLAQGWQSANTLSGLAVGTALEIQNQGDTAIYVAMSPTQPEASFRGIVMSIGSYYTLNIPADESEVWVRPIWSVGTPVINIQEA